MENKIYKYIIDIMTILLFVFVILGSFCAAFTIFVFITSVIGTCYYLVNASEIISQDPTRTLMLCGAGVIALIGYVKSFNFLARLVARWEKVVRPKKR